MYSVELNNELPLKCIHLLKYYICKNAHEDYIIHKIKLSILEV
jgi:hypothetical protein